MKIDNGRHQENKISNKVGRGRIYGRFANKPGQFPNLIESDLDGKSRRALS